MIADAKANAARVLHTSPPLESYIPRPSADVDTVRRSTRVWDLLEDLRGQTLDIDSADERADLWLCNRAIGWFYTQLTNITSTDKIMDDDSQPAKEILGRENLTAEDILETPACDQCSGLAASIS